MNEKHTVVKKCVCWFSEFSQWIIKSKTISKNIGTNQGNQMLIQITKFAIIKRGQENAPKSELDNGKEHEIPQRRRISQQRHI